MNIRYFIMVSCLLFIVIIGCKKKYQPVQSSSTNNNYNIFYIINAAQSPLPSDSVRDLFVLNQKLFICTSKGLALLENNNWQIFNTSNSGLISNDVTCCVATDSVWWIGTKNGLTKYSTMTYQWKSWTVSNSSLPSNKIRSLCLDKNNVLWIGTFSGGGLARFDGTSWQIFTPSNSPLPSNSVAKIYFQDSIYWIGTAGGLTKYNGTAWKTFTPGNSALNSAWVYDIIQGKNDELWIATNNGINYYHVVTDSWQRFNSTNSGLSSNFTRGVFYDSSRNMLFVTTEGNGFFVYNVSDNKWQQYQYPPYNVSSNYMKDVLMYNGKIWIATIGNGILIFNN